MGSPRDLAAEVPARSSGKSQRNSGLARRRLYDRRRLWFQWTRMLLDFL
jgi:hypothetical protein